MTAVPATNRPATGAAGGNAAWLERSRAAVWHPCTQMKLHETLPLVPIARAQGVWLEDFDGHRILDAISSWWVNLFGHGEPRIRAAIADQAGRLEHAMLAGFTHTPALEKGITTRTLETGAMTTHAALGRLIEPREIANAVAFLASDRASAITGINLPVDAGYLVATPWASYGGLRR